jgi:NitT/TauT family transport system substrate-binding protein
MNMWTNLGWNHSASFSARRLCLAICLGVLPFISSCFNEPPAPLRIASSPWPGYEPLYLARDLGYFGSSKVNILELPSSDITLESFRNRSADMATLTLDEALELLSNGVKLRVLFVMDSSNGADAVMAAPQVKTLADLKGKRIAIINIPLGVYMLSRLLDAAKLTRDDVNVVPVNESRHASLYKQNSADAFITFEPFKSELAALGARPIFDSSQIPNEIFDLMLVHEEVFQARREEVCDVARQWFRVLETLRQSPDEAAAGMAKRLGVSVQGYRNMAKGIVVPAQAENLRLLAGTAPALVPPSENLSQVMLKAGQMKRSADIRHALPSDIGACIAK